MSEEASSSQYLAEDGTRPASPRFSQSSSRSFPHYRMDHPRRGVAAIFNHESFEDSGVTERQGSEKDVDSLCRTLDRLGFEVETFLNLTFKEILLRLEELSQRDHSQCDCFVLVFMSHGLEGKLRSKDVVFDVHYLWDYFTPEQAPTLEDKPKIFIIQACQGHGRQGGVRVAEEEVEESSVNEERVTLVPGYILPSSPDFLIALSTIPGFVSWRNPLKGSWYIQTLCAHLDRRGLEEDLITLLTHVGREIAVEYSVIDVQEENAHKKQLPSVISYLSKKVQFTRKHSKSGEKRRKRKINDCENDGFDSNRIEEMHTNKDSKKRRKVSDD